MKTKKTFKAVIAMTLALILSLGTMTAAFAANKGDITWTVYDETVSCTYLSDLTVGTNTVAVKESGYYYFDLSGLENGYYSVEITDDPFEYFALPEKSGNVYNGWGDMELIDGVEYLIFNRKDNVDIAVAGAYGASESVTIDIEFLGEDIESIEIGGENFDELLLDYDIREYDYYSDDEYRVYLDTVVTFTSGKEIEVENQEYFFTCEEGIKKGENTVELDFVDYKTEVTLNVSLISDYIAGIEIENAEDITAYVYYNGTAYFDYNIMDITVVFTDGTKVELSNGSPVILPNGREVGIDGGYGFSSESNKVYFSYNIADYEFEVIEVNTEKVPLKKNIGVFQRNMDFRIFCLESSFEYFFDNLKSGNYENISGSFNSLTYELSTFAEQTAKEIGCFIAFMFS